GKTRENTPAWSQLHSVHIVLTYLAPARAPSVSPETRSVLAGEDDQSLSNFRDFLKSYTVQPSNAKPLTSTKIADARQKAADALRKYRQNDNKGNLEEVKTALEHLYQQTKNEYGDPRRIAQSTLVNGMGPPSRFDSAGTTSLLTSIVQPISMSNQL